VRWPAGLRSTASSGAITGHTERRPASFSFTVLATDTNGVSGSRGYAFTVKLRTGTITITVTTRRTLPVATQGSAYRARPVELRPGGHRTLQLHHLRPGRAGPAGLALNSSQRRNHRHADRGGRGRFSFTVLANRRLTGGKRAAAAYSFTVNPAATHHGETPRTLPAATQGSAYSQTVEREGGAPHLYSFTISAGALPARPLRFNSSSGARSPATPTAAGFSF